MLITYQKKKSKFLGVELIDKAIAGGLKRPRFSAQQVQVAVRKCLWDVS
jgi:hypothetical protein